MKRDHLISQLATDVAPVAPVPAPTRTAALWLAGTWLLVVAATRLFGPFRSGFAEQLAASPQFAGESALGLLAGIAAASLAFSLGVPAPRRGLARPAFAVALLLSWVAAYVLGLLSPALEPSMAGKRPHCFVETLAYSVPALVLGLALLRRYVVLDRSRAGALLGAAAAAAPALVMQLACMYDPLHTLTLHLSPVFFFGAAGAWLATRALPEL